MSEVRQELKQEVWVRGRDGVSLIKVGGDREVN